MAENKDGRLFSHSEFEEALKRGLEKLQPTKDNMPLTQDEFASALSAVIDNANTADNKPISVAIESNKNVTWLALPATGTELNRALMDINALDKEYAIVDCKTSLGIALEKVIIGGDISEVNYLAARLRNFRKYSLISWRRSRKIRRALPAFPK